MTPTLAVILILAAYNIWLTTKMFSLLNERDKLKKKLSAYYEMFSGCCVHEETL